MILIGRGCALNRRGPRFQLNVASLALGEALTEHRDEMRSKGGGNKGRVSGR
jgi:hypothetical protein